MIGLVDIFQQYYAGNAQDDWKLSHQPSVGRGLDGNFVSVENILVLLHK
jgi:hypothetical protein